VGGGRRFGELALQSVEAALFSPQKGYGISPARMDVNKLLSYCSPLSDP